MFDVRDERGATVKGIFFKTGTSSSDFCRGGTRSNRHPENLNHSATTALTIPGLFASWL